MIRLGFITGGSIRKVIIDERVVTMFTQETGFTPVTINLEEIDEKKVEEQMGKEGLEFIKEMQELETEEEIAKDIIRDFQTTGWRLVTNEHY